VRPAVLFALALFCLPACAAQPGAGGGDAGSAGSGAGSAAGGIEPTENDLAVELDRGDGSPLERYTLVCAGVAEGTHPDAQAACEHLRGMADPFAPLPDDLMCTEQYGGPQTAHVSGRWGGQPVDLQLSRVNGCLISQWDGLGPLLPT
jgi:Subtilisin inhibitor-like